MILTTSKWQILPQINRQRCA